MLSPEPGILHLRNLPGAKHTETHTHAHTRTRRANDVTICSAEVASVVAEAGGGEQGRRKGSPGSRTNKLRLFLSLLSTNSASFVSLSLLVLFNDLKKSLRAAAVWRTGGGRPRPGAGEFDR